MATAEQLIKNPDALARAERIWANDGVYQKSVQRNPDTSPIHLVATHTLHRGHAVFGKTSRPEIFKGALGAGMFPFLTWPYHQWGRLTEQAASLGVPGKVGFVTTLLAMWVLGGLVGLPGFELFKELYEAAYKKLGNREIDVINQIHQHYDDNRFKAEMITHGISRAGGGLDVAQRFGWPLPAQEFVLSAIGSKKDPTAVLGVPGTILSGVIRAVNNYNNQAGALTIAQDVMPVALSNIIKAMDYSQNGVKSRAGVTIMPPEDLTPADIWSRAFGMNTAHLARERERHFFAQVLSRSHQPKYNALKKRMTTQLEKAIRAEENDQPIKAKKHWSLFDKAEQDLIDWSVESGYYPPMLELNRILLDGVNQKLTGDLRWDDISKQNRHLVAEMEERLKSWNK
jgi:hypothetical protein